MVVNYLVLNITALPPVIVSTQQTSLLMLLREKVYL